MNRVRNLLGAVAVATLGLGWSSAWAIAEIEPNNDCENAHNVRNKTSITGEIVEADVDYFKVRADAGSLLQIDMTGSTTGGGTLDDTVVGAFTANCNFIGSDDDSGEGTESRLVVTVPPNGTLIIAAAAYPDSNFVGATTTHLGTYKVKLSVYVPPPGLSLRVLDGETDAPFDTDEGAFAALLACADPTAGMCDLVADLQSADEAGHVFFNTEGLPAGRYLVIATTSNYDDSYAYTATMDLTDGVEADLGDLVVHPTPVTFSDIVPPATAAPGGNARFSVTVTNTTQSPLTALIGPVVATGLNGAPAGFATFVSGFHGRFQATEVPLAAGETKVVEQSIHVPATTPTGVSFTVDFNAYGADGGFNALGFKPGFESVTGSAGAARTGVMLKKALEQRGKSRRDQFKVHKAHK